jgi:hypothetical protein
MKLISKLLSNFSIWLIPIVLVIASLGLNLGNAEMHKNSLKSNDFYTKLSNELKSSEVNEENVKLGFSSIIISTLAEDLITPGWLQNLSENNIDEVTGWLNGDEQGLVFYLPNKEIEDAVAKSLDAKTKEATENLSDEIPTCTVDAGEALKREGISLDANFCLPESVKNGEQSLSEFIGISGEDANDSEFLNKLIRNNPLTPLNDRIKATDLPENNRLRNIFVNQINTVRSSYIFLNSNVIYLFGLVAGLFILSLIIAKISNKQMIYELKRLLLYSGVGTVSLAAIIILMLGGTLYFSSLIPNIILPGFGTSQLNNLVAFEAVKFLFNILSSAVWIALSMIAIYLVLLFTHNNETFAKTGKKNKELKENYNSKFLKPQQNDTFDSEFRNKIYSQPITSPDPEAYSDSNFFATPGDENKIFQDDVNVPESIRQQYIQPDSRSENLTGQPVSSSEFIAPQLDPSFGTIMPEDSNINTNYPNGNDSKPSISSPQNGSNKMQF